jgi:2-polyprenyl-6-methoxyphenol hydroxylase-like FAD-dependent oxidoreductase
MRDENATDVLIVGAGPVGLCCAIELGQRGVRCLVVEKNDRVGYNPRAKLTNVRSREHLRRWGIADALRRASPIPPDYPGTVMFLTRFNGYHLAQFENALTCSPEINEFYSESGQWVPQYTLEEVLREHAESFPNVTVRFNCRFADAEQSADGVTSQIVDNVTGRATTVHSSYVVGADGVRSSVRELLGFPLDGTHGMAKFYNMVFLAPELAKSHAFGGAIQYWFVNPELSGILAPMDDGVEGKWFLGVPLPPGAPDAEQLDPRDLLRRVCGIDCEVELVGRDPWTSHALITPHYAQGRIFLAGDACHIHPPFGGYGMNMGMGDAVDLGWKIAATLQGWGGPGLLDTYETERRPVHRLILEEAVENQKVLGNHLVHESIEHDGPEADAIRARVGDAIRASKRREFDTIGVTLGYRYDDSPVIAGDGTPAPPVDYRTYVPSARPGCVAPHTWLADGSSLYDHFGIGFTLLVTGDDDPVAEARLAGAAARRGIPFTVAAPRAARVAELYGARFALIRPDQHVAWRGDALPDDADALVGRITGFAPVAHAVAGGIS